MGHANLALLAKMILKILVIFLRANVKVLNLIKNHNLQKFYNFYKLLVIVFYVTL